MYKPYQSILPLVLATAAIGAASAPAALLFYDGFAADDYTPGSINGQPTAGIGYQAGGTFGTSSQFLSGGLTSGALATTDGVRLSRTNGEVVANFDTSPGGTFGSAGLVGTNGKIGGTGVTGTIYFSVLGNRTDTQVASFAGFNVYDEGTEGIGVGEVAGNNYSWLQSGGNGAIGDPGTALVTGETNLFVFSLDYVDGSPMTATIWLAPDPALSEGAQAAGISSVVTNASPGNGFDSFRLRGSRVWEWDELRVGTTWEDVTPVVIPEPSSSLFTLLALSGLALRRARRS